MKGYKEAFLRRRLEMGRNEVEARSVPYSKFFRNWEIFTFLERYMVNRGKRSVRCWVPGCARGEEVYSLAAIFENLGLIYTIIATDINKKLIREGRKGIYSISYLKEIPKRFLNTFFKVEEQCIKACPQNGRIIWGTQDLLKDPYLINLDVLSCRNVIMYFARSSQKMVLERFAFSLKEGGILILGEKERIPDELTECYRETEQKGVYMLVKRKVPRWTASSLTLPRKK